MASEFDSVYFSGLAPSILPSPDARRAESIQRAARVKQRDLDNVNRPRKRDIDVYISQRFQTRKLFNQDVRKNGAFYLKFENNPIVCRVTFVDSAIRSSMQKIMRMDDSVPADEKEKLKRDMRTQDFQMRFVEPRGHQGEVFPASGNLLLMTTACELFSHVGSYLIRAELRGVQMVPQRHGSGIVTLSITAFVGEIADGTRFLLGAKGIDTRTETRKRRIWHLTPPK